ncbi:MAG: prephenate dehydrogenase [Truepera sp.]|nr:prephenate dehydrogenase [Truepera sp.]
MTRPSALFDTIVLAGVGLIGGSVGLGIHQRFLAKRVVGFDRDPAALDAARGMGVIDEAHFAPGPWLEEADLVVLATPVRSLTQLGLELAPYLRADCIVTDVGSVKREIVTGLERIRFVGGHPMAGSEGVGVQNADAALLENAVWVLTPTDDTDPEALEQVEDFVKHLGARPLRIDPDQHDRLVASVSHVPYLVAVALTEFVAQDEDRELMMLLAAGGFRDLTRVASGNPQMSRDMVVGNREAIRQALRGFVAQLELLAGQLDEPDRLLERAESVKRTRDGIPVVRRSLLPARFEVVLAVPDRPGELARITQAVGAAGVNIRDIEVLSIREAGGALRLAFDNEEGLRLGSEALRAAGYEVRSER